MDARLVTFSVQIGAGGIDIARAVANRLGFRYYDWEVTSRAAQEAGVSPETLAAAERVPGFLERIFQRMASAGVYVDESSVPLAAGSAMSFQAVRTLTSDEYRDLIERTIGELAHQGEAVIVGHACQVVLRDEPGVLRVLVHGSPEERAKRLALEERLTSERARDLVRQSDADRAKFFRHFYRVDVLDASLYDLAVDTDRLDLKAAADLVVGAAQAIAGGVTVPG